MVRYIIIKGIDNMIHSDPKILLDHLQSLFLGCCSVMSAAVNTLVNGYRFKIKLEICGDSNPGYPLFIEIAKKLNVDFETVEIPTDSVNYVNKWLSDRGTKNLRVWIPDMQYREGDFHVMLPFYLNYHLKELRKRDPNFPSHMIDNLYERAEVISIHHYGSEISDEVRTVNGKVDSMSDLSRLYLGFCSGSEGWELVKDSEIENHPFNRFSRNKIHATSVTASHRGYIGFPVLIRHYIWNIEQISAITQNAWALNTYDLQGSAEELDKTRKCLLLRLQGKSEDEIEKELDFDDNEKYYQWQISRLIDIDPKRFRDPLENWLDACKFFDIEPNIEILENNTETSKSNAGGSSDTREHSSEKAQPTAPFKHSPDFRSILTYDGEFFTLTEKQAHVISELYNALESGTPELSQGFLIEAVYGDVAENRIKKLFANNEAWKTLIETGSRKGLVRLKVNQSSNKK
jgi:hypothetical protein